jgi:hypothetical protein
MELIRKIIRYQNKSTNKQIRNNFFWIIRWEKDFFATTSDRQQLMVSIVNNIKHG